MSNHRESLIEFADFSFDLETFFLRQSGKAVPLKKQSAEVLALLVQNAGEVVSREQIRDHVWKNRLIEFDQGINACIRDIRQALGDNPRNPRFVETHPRIGYRFSAQVVHPGIQSARLRLRWALVMLALAVAIVAWATGAFGPLSPPGPETFDRERIAVMPFRTLLDEPESSAAAEKLTALFVLRLSEAQSRVLVISADDLFGKDRPEPGMGDVSRWLEADYILAGALQRAEGETIVGVRLIRTDGYVALWTRSVPFDSVDTVNVDDLIPQIIESMEPDD